MIQQKSPTKSVVKVLYIVTINATTSIPLEAAGKIEAISGDHGIEFNAATYYKQTNAGLRSDFVKNLTELNFKSANSLTTLKEYNQLIRKIKPDIVHLHHGVSAFQGAVLSKLAGVPFVFKTEHNDHKHYKWYQKILTVPVFMLADKIITNSKTTLRSFYPWEKWIAGNKSLPIYNGINVDAILKYNTPENTVSTRKQYSISSTDKLFVSVGRLVPQKNYETVIRGFIEACKLDSSIKLIIAGGGSQQEYLQQIINDNNVAGQITLLGMIQRSEVYRLVNAADVFVIGSLWEGFCNAVVEAMAAGKPILSSDIVTLREVVGDDAGIFFDPYSPTAVNSGVAEICSFTGEKLHAIGVKAKDRALNNFTIERTAENYIKQYVETLKN